MRRGDNSWGGYFWHRPAQTSPTCTAAVTINAIFPALFVDHHHPHHLHPPEFSCLLKTSPFLPAPFPRFLPSFPPSYIPEPFPEFLAETVTSSDRNIPTAGRTRENGSSQRLTFDPRPAASSFVRCQTAPDVFEGSGSRQGQRS